MADLVVRAQGLGKRYAIGGPPRRGRVSLREILAALPAAAWRKLRRAAADDRAHDHNIWALRGVSFEVSRGEILGIIGPNGSGKTTLMMVTAGIMEPTEGWVATRGRIGSLLGVGAGFHPELTGRENVILNGIILGMRASDVRRRFDEIVAFAGVDRLVDTPVKHYSSGMYMRLAFSVAAHLEPDVLIIDEVLAVGDAAFRAKCLGKMDEARDQGRTTLFVTHDMALVRRLCTHALLLRQGRAIDYGPADDVALRYAEMSDGDEPGRGSAATSPASVPLPPGAPGIPAWATRLTCLTAGGAPGMEVVAGEPWMVRLDFQVGRVTDGLAATLNISVRSGPALVTLASMAQTLAPGSYRTDFVVDLPLAPAELSLGVGLVSRDRLLYVADDVRHVRLRGGAGEAGGRRDPRGGVLLAGARPPIVPVVPPPPAG